MVEVHFSGSQTILVMYRLSNIFSIEYNLSIIMSAIIRNVPNSIVIVLSR